MATLYNTYLIHCKTSVHAGDGSSTGTIDNPIQREKTTGFPVFRDSTLRGAIRESFENDETIQKNEVFVPAFGNKDNGEVASAIDVYPAKLLFFPVRSLKGVFAFVTCPLILTRYLEDRNRLLGEKKPLNIPDLEYGQAIFPENLRINDHLGLEEFLFKKLDNDNFEMANFLNLLPENNIDRLSSHWAIIDNTSFAYFTKLFTEKVTRNKINIETGVAEDGGLFNVENLPEESILYTTIGFSNEFSKKEEKKSAVDIQSYFTDNLKPMIQLGGNKSIGKGLLQLYPISKKD